MSEREDQIKGAATIRSKRQCSSGNSDLDKAISWYIKIGFEDGAYWADANPKSSSLHGVVCPFCEEDNFDLIGLKHHFHFRHCDKYNSTEIINGYA